MNRPVCLVWFGLFVGLAIPQHPAAAEQVVRVKSRDELVRALYEAQAGTTIQIAPGRYAGGLSTNRLRGTKDKPITIGAADAAHPPVIEGGGGGLHLSSPEHLVLHDLVLSGARGNGLNIDDGATPDKPASFVTLRNLVVRDVGPEGNRDGIKLSGVSDFRVEGCRVERWGSGGSAIDMVGCHDGVVTGSTFREATGDGANGVQMKGGSSAIVVQRCRFENAGGRAVNIGGSTGLDFFRPRDAKNEASRITVEDCEFLGGQAAIAFVGVDGALVQHNTIYRSRRWPIRILQENTDSRFVPCRKGRFINNVVAFRSDETRQVVNIGGGTLPETFEFSGNAWCCLDRPADTRRLVRLPAQEANGKYGIEPRFKDPENGDVSLRQRAADDAGVRTK